MVSATFGYDGDGRMVTATVGVTTTYYVGSYFEKVNGITHTYYYHGGKRIAMRVGNTLYWLLTDHPSATLRAGLASTSIVVALHPPRWVCPFFSSLAGRGTSAPMSESCKCSELDQQGGLALQGSTVNGLPSAKRINGKCRSPSVYPFCIR